MAILKVWNADVAEWESVTGATGGDFTEIVGLAMSADYTIRIDGSNYVAHDSRGTLVTTNSTLAAVFDAIKVEGCHIHFLPGDFTAESEMALLSRMVVTGSGYSTRINRTTAGNIFTIVGLVGNHLPGNRISGFRLTGPSISSNQIAGNGVYIQYADRFEVSNMWINGFGSLGDDGGITIATKGAFGFVHHNRCWGNKNGVCLGSPTSPTLLISDTILANNECYSNYDDGMHSQRCTRITYANNICYLNASGGAADGAGIDVLGDRDDIIIGNTCYDNNRGIEVGQTAQSGANGDRGHVVSGNSCWSNTDYGITLIGQMQDVLVIGNNIRENGSDGIRFGTATANLAMTDTTVRGNIIHDNGTSGIDIFGYVSGATVADNDLSGHSNADVRVRTSTGSPTTYAVVYNRFRSTTGLSDVVNHVGKIVTGNY
jgi:hypothetical protein